MGHEIDEVVEGLDRLGRREVGVFKKQRSLGLVLAPLPSEIVMI
jgi:hypothetical protein